MDSAVRTMPPIHHALGENKIIICFSDKSVYNKIIMMANPTEARTTKAVDSQLPMYRHAMTTPRINPAMVTFPAFNSKKG
jgi:hypothetical protein